MAKNQRHRVSPWSSDSDGRPAPAVTGDLRDMLPGGEVSPAVSLQHRLIAQFDEFDGFAGLTLPPRSRLYRLIESIAASSSRLAGPVALVVALGGIAYLVM